MALALKSAFRPLRTLRIFLSYIPAPVMKRADDTKTHAP